MRVLWITIFSFFLVSCGTEKLGHAFEESKFENTKYNYFLAFDLAFDNEPKAALIVKNSLPEGHYTTNVHFRAKDVQLNKKLYSAVGKYDDYMLVDFDISKSSPPISSISFVPVLSNSDDDEIRNFGYKEKVYLLRRGLERQFIYNYEETASQKKLFAAPRTSSEIKPQTISVNLPKGARGIEIGNSRKTSSPEPDHIENNVYFYPYIKPKTGEQHLEIKYMIKETPTQELIVDGLIKLVLVLIPSGIALLLIQSKEIIDPGIRKYGLYACGALTIVAIGGLLFYSFYLNDKAAQKSVVDIGIAIIAGVFAALVFYTKKDES
jgi:hypothetical protein